MSCSTLWGINRRRRRGFTLIELTITIGLMAILIGLLMQFLLTVLHVVANEGAGMKLQYSSGYNIDVLTQDVQSSDLALASYTASGTTYTADTSTTLVLRTPSLNSTGTGTTTTSDHIIYQLVATAAGASNGPYTLNRTVLPATGSGRAAVSNQIVATNLSSASFSYIAAQSQTQAAAGTAKSFTLIDSATYSAPGNSTVIQQAISEGTDYCAGSTTCYSGSTVTVPTAPPANGTIDFRFTVNPATTVSSTVLANAQPSVTLNSGETANYAKEIIVTLQLVAQAGNGNSLSAPAPAMTLTTTAALRNKAVF